MKSIYCVLMRGGTSKGVFFKREDLPEEGSKRDEVIMKVFGSGDPAQIDGLGGAQTVTSKTMIVSKSDKPDFDVEYTFGQVGIGRAMVDYTGNCGNLTTAISPFAIDEKILKAKEPYTKVRMLNTNTKKRIDVKIPVEGRFTKYEGDYQEDGVPHPGARIDVEWYDPGGAITGKLLPTGNPLDKIATGSETIDGSMVDASNPALFVRAKDVGLTGMELPNDITPDSQIKLERIRSKAAEILGFVKDAREATVKSSHFPYIVIVNKPQDYKTTEGKIVKKSDYSVLARLFSLQKMHHAYAVTGAICTGAAAKIPNTIVSELSDVHGDKIIIGHPKGALDVSVKALPFGDSVKIKSVTVGRTARRLMAGMAYYIQE